MIKSLKDNGTIEILSNSALKMIKGGEATPGGQELTLLEPVKDANGNVIGHNYHYTTWTSDERDGNELCQFGVDRYTEYKALPQG